MFDHSKDAHNAGDHFLGSQFETKEACLEFANKVQILKGEHMEMGYTIHCTTNPVWNPFVGF